MKVADKFNSAYDASKYEAKIYEKWYKSGYFNPDKCLADGIADQTKKPFSIILPPPNVTGHLHIGHASMLAIEDVLVRYYRMNGHPTLWIPGTDHASIATTAKFKKIHQKETGRRQNDYTREEFTDLIHEYAVSNQKYIINQLKESGASLDWSRLTFTLDEQREKAVVEAFRKMYEADLIYQKDRIVNWDPKGQTTVSDDEIVYKEGTAELYTFKYSPDFPITIASTQPETKVGDTAVAVHPEDERYKELIGQTFIINDFCGVKLEIKVVGDEAVDPEYGTGALGVTPAHSIIDSEIAERHNLPTKQVINEYAKMMPSAGQFLEGEKTKDARKKVVKWLQDNNLLESTEEVKQNLPTAERTGGIIEPLPKLQWWISVNKEFVIDHSEIKGIKSGSKTTLKELMLKAVEQGQTKIIPERYERVYYDWINKLRDWNISRQIIYGHRVPVWYKNEIGSDEIFIGASAPDDSGQWIQDEDTLDTWFSSGLWPFSALGWPDKTDDLETYFPNSLLETGDDIIFFWVARMILMSTFITGKAPFETVYMHGMVRDERGRKMSKSLGNTVEPSEMTDKYGTDALRMALLIGVGPGADNNLGENKVKAYRNFANKIWNAARFTLMSLPDNYQHTSVELTNNDQNLLDEFNELIKDISSDIENFRLHLASEKLYGYFWHTFADQIIEAKKSVVGDNYDTSNPESLSATFLLAEILSTSLKALHPFIPFVTEEIWQKVRELHPESRDMLLISEWPLINND